MERLRLQRTLTINGLRVDAGYDAEDVETVFLPLLRRLTDMAHMRKGRVVVFLAAPPAVGKSTLGAFLEQLSGESAELEPIRCIGLDGFHYTNAELERRGLSLKKGAPETFDVERLARMLESGAERFPVYSRRLHEPVEDAITVKERILLAEGNWLLLEEAPWDRLRCDLSVFLRPTRPELLRERLIARKIAGGSPREAAELFVDGSDMRNIDRCLGHSGRADIELLVDGDGRFTEV